MAGSNYFRRSLIFPRRSTVILFTVALLFGFWLGQQQRQQQQRQPRLSSDRGGKKNSKAVFASPELVTKDSILFRQVRGNFFKQHVPLSRHGPSAHRLDLFTEECRNKIVLHVGCTDWPIFDPKKNLHIVLSRVAGRIDCLDPDREGLENMKKYVKHGNFFSDAAQVTGHYDLVLVPETIEHVPNIGLFLASLGRLNFDVFIITGPNLALNLVNHFRMIDGSVLEELIHADHKIWVSPYTLANAVEQFIPHVAVTNVYLLEGNTMAAVRATATQRASIPFPEIAHFYWDPPNPLTWLHFFGLASFRKFHPGWRMLLHTPKPSERYNGTRTWKSGEQGGSYFGPDFFPFVSSLGVEVVEFDFATHGLPFNVPENFKGDLVRLAVLYEMGGVWSDLDNIFTKSVESLLAAHPVDVIICYKQNHFPLGVVMARRPGLEIFSILMQKAKEQYSGSKYQSVGPTLWKKVLIDPSHTRDRFSDLTFFFMKGSHCIPYAFTEGDDLFVKDTQGKASLDDTFCVHWFNGLSQSRTFQNAVLDPNSKTPYESLVWKLVAPFLPTYRHVLLQLNLTIK